MPNQTHPTVLLLCAGLGVLGLIVLIGKCRVHAFVGLILASLFVGLTSGMDLPGLTRSFQEGVGSMLGSIAVVVGLGMVLGRLLGESGGADVLARTLISAMGEERLVWALMLVGFVVGIPVFFTVGVVLLVPLLFTLVQETKRPLLQLGVPLTAGLSAVHGLVPPHPGPMAAIGITGADPGRVILYSLAVALPSAIVAGPCFGYFIRRRADPSAADRAKAYPAVVPSVNPPSFLLSICTILLPVFLMLGAAVADLVVPRGVVLRDWIDFIGSPIMAMLAATVFAFFSFGLARGYHRDQILKMTEDSLAPAASILLIVGAGGGFNRVLVASGVGDALASMAKTAQLSPLLLGWMTAALIRVATGSATVAITTAAGIVTPMAVSVPGTRMELLVIAMGAGSLVLSHVNDGGFWFVKEYFGLSIVETLRSWTVMETIIGVVGLLATLLLACILK